MRYACYVLVLVLGVLPSNGEAQSNVDKDDPSKGGKEVPWFEVDVSEPVIARLYIECMAESEFCSGYVMGVGHTLRAMGTIGATAEGVNDGNTVGICPASPTTDITDMGQVFIDWAEKNDDRWAEDMLIGVWVAFNEEWPCP